MSKIQKIISVFVMVVTLSFVLINIAHALPAADDQLGMRFGAETGLGSADVRVTVGAVIRTAIGLLGIVAVVIILIGGFTWMTAGGNDDKVAEAKKWIFSGVIGLIIILSAYSITSFVLSKLVEATTTSTF